MDLPWTAPVPPGEVRTEVNPPTLKVKLYSWAFVTTFIAGTTVGLRIFTRFSVTRTPLNTDDYLIVISLLFAISTIVVLFQQVEVGLAHHMWDILWDVYNVHNTGWTIAATIVYALSISFSKLSILFLYLRLSPQVWFRRGVFFLIGLVVSYSIVYVLINIFGCTPIRAGWDLNIVEKTCVDKFSIYLSLSIANIAMDVLILLLPIPVVVPLQMARRQKFSIILLFGTGVFVCGVATKRTVHLPKLLASPDYTWEAVEAFIWGYLELNAGMICASVPALKPFFMRYLPSFITSRLGSSNRGGSSLNKSSKSRLNTVVAQNMERRRRQDESYELSSTDGKRDGVEDDETKLWSGYQKNVKAALGGHARETSRQVDDNSNSSVDTLGEMTGPRRGDRTVVVSAESSAPGGCGEGSNGIMVRRETTVQHGA
ncbi:Satratoxin biosynthesis SC1 cluster protein 4 [Colletotrichum siamense]|nr:Satratoxin biosynthesis SC1 cluster protein 4 [Colletotrichum siamense]